MRTLNIFKTGKILLTPAVILLLGILFHSSVFFAMNKFISPVDLSLAQQSTEIIDTRLALRAMAEKGFSLSSVLSFLISVILIYAFIKNGSFVPYSRLFICYFASTVLALLFSVPFALLDSEFSADYILPVISSWPAITLLFAILLILNWGKNKN